MQSSSAFVCTRYGTNPFFFCVPMLCVVVNCNGDTSPSYTFSDYGTHKDTASAFDREVFGVIVRDDASFSQFPSHVLSALFLHISLLLIGGTASRTSIVGATKEGAFPTTAHCYSKSTMEHILSSPPFANKQVIKDSPIAHSPELVSLLERQMEESKATSTACSTASVACCGRIH